MNSATFKADSATGPGEAPGDARVFQLTPNCSLTPATARLFMIFTAAMTFGVAGFFAAKGFWPVLLFAALELGVLYWALAASMRDGQRRETITITADSVTVDRYSEAGSERSVFPRSWVRVKLRVPPAALHPSRLTFESHGRACEVGRFLTEDERRSLAVRLKQLVGNMNETPAL